MIALLGCQLIGCWRIAEADLWHREHLGLGGLGDLGGLDILKAKRDLFFNSLLGENRHSAIVVHAPSHQLTRRYKNRPVVNENSGKGRRRKLPSSVECLAALVVQIVLSVRQVSLDASKHLPIDVVAAETKPALLQAVRHEAVSSDFFDQRARLRKSGIGLKCPSQVPRSLKRRM